MFLTYQDVVVAYRGTGQGSRLESALRGPMRSMLPADEVSPIINWVNEGADRARYEQLVKPVLEKRCYSCHDGSNPHLVNLNGYDNVKKVAERDTGHRHIHTRARLSYTSVRPHDGFLHRGPDLQPRVCAARLAEVPGNRASILESDDRHQLVVHHEAFSAICCRCDGGRRSDGFFVRFHVVRVHVSACGSRRRPKLWHTEDRAIEASFRNVCDAPQSNETAARIQIQSPAPRSTDVIAARCAFAPA